MPEPSPAEPKRPVLKERKPLFVPDWEGGRRRGTPDAYAQPACAVIGRG